ncbi:MAG: hypothetical protein QOE13_3456, partial [Gaiellaceae bacterium]|nr:hypothetical protein [Gaiellaceae bacterium]
MTHDSFSHAAEMGWIRINEPAQAPVGQRDVSASSVVGTPALLDQAFRD